MNKNFKFDNGKLYLNYGTDKEKLLGEVVPDIHYLLLDYRSNLCDSELYDNDPEMDLKDKDFALFRNEVSHLQDRGIKIIDDMKNYGMVIIEDSDDLEYIPYIGIEPDLMACSKTGFPCDLCGNNCPDVKICQHKKFDDTPENNVEEIQNKIKYVYGG